MRSCDMSQDTDISRPHATTQSPVVFEQLESRMLLSASWTVMVYLDSDQLDVFMGGGFDGAPWFEVPGVISSTLVTTDGVILSIQLSAFENYEYISLTEASILQGTEALDTAIA